MFRSSRPRLLVVVTVAAVLVSGFVLGGDGTTTDRKIVVPSFSVEVVVSPATGAIEIAAGEASFSTLHSPGSGPRQ